MARSTAETGQAGEDFAERYLLEHGYEIISRNWRVRGGEIDIVALDSEALVFVEVKVRALRGPVLAESTVDVRKLRRIMVAAEAFFYEHPDYLDHVWRVDLIALTMDQAGVVRGFKHYQNLTDDD